MEKLTVFVRQTLSINEKMCFSETFDPECQKWLSIEPGVDGCGGVNSASLDCPATKAASMVTKASGDTKTGSDMLSLVISHIKGAAPLLARRTTTRVERASLLSLIWMQTFVAVNEVYMLLGSIDTTTSK